MLQNSQELISPFIKRVMQMITRIAASTAAMCFLTYLLTILLVAPRYRQATFATFILAHHLLVFLLLIIVPWCCYVLLYNRGGFLLKLLGFLGLFFPVVVIHYMDVASPLVTICGLYYQIITGTIPLDTDFMQSVMFYLYTTAQLGTLYAFILITIGWSKFNTDLKPRLPQITTPCIILGVATPLLSLSKFIFPILDTPSIVGWALLFPSLAYLLQLLSKIIPMVFTLPDKVPFFHQDS